jgi:predicted hotdog family 3-hydroxylacyl-ACP dehydratase
MVIGRDEIAALIPHAGEMCLLDGVIDWSATSIRCLSRRHMAEDNPLRSHARLGAVCGIEFAAQAMALHGSLCAGGADRPPHGYLASVRQVTCRCDRLDRFATDLTIEAERLAGDERQAMYRFALRCADIELLSGRAAVVMEATPA